MAEHTLTDVEMTALGDYVFEENGFNGDTIIASTGHSPADWVQEINDALICSDSSLFGKNYRNRSVAPPFPPKNLDGPIEPPDSPATAQLKVVSNKFVGFKIEV